MRVLIVAIALAALPACAETSQMGAAPSFGAAYTPSEPTPAPAPARRSKVIVLQTGDSRATEILGLIDFHAEMGDQDKALEGLKAKAESLGADAVTAVEFHHGEGKEPSHLSGTAVRFRDLLGGRKYEAIQKIEVVFEMEQEDEGLRGLKEKARQLHADLIIDVKFEHGEEGQKPRVSGTAIRFVQ